MFGHAKSGTEHVLQTETENPHTQLKHQSFLGQGHAFKEATEILRKLFKFQFASWTRCKGNFWNKMLVYGSNSYLFTGNVEQYDTYTFAKQMEPPVLSCPGFAIFVTH